MRIIAGELKGRRLLAPTWPGLRPTSDRLRETLFAILGGAVRDAAVLDGFAGSGAIGLEALSRGAASVTFVENDRRAASLIKANVERCGVSSRGRIIQGTLPGALGRTSDPAVFDLVLLDPPYEFDDGTISAILSALIRRTTPGGLLVMERPSRRRALEVEATGSSALGHTRRVRAGDSALDFYRCGKDESAAT